MDGVLDCTFEYLKERAGNETLQQSKAVSKGTAVLHQGFQLVHTRIILRHILSFLDFTTSFQPYTPSRSWFPTVEICN
jgi:hypothetical protein